MKKLTKIALKKSERTVFGVLLIAIIVACNHADKPDYPVLSVDVTRMNPPSLFDIFKKIEIIPLETTEHSLIGGSASKIIFYNNHYYILDAPNPSKSFYCFDEQGKFVRKIGNEGRGPEEYIFVQNFVINESNHTAELLSPFGTIYTYELSGKFVGKKRLPDLVPNYQHIKLLNDSIRILLSATDNNQDQLYVYSTQSNTIVNSYYQENPAIFQWSCGKFYQYNNAIYFCKPLVSKVFKIDQHGYEVAYAWDFGALNPENIKFDTDITNERLSEMFRNSQIKGFLFYQSQNDNYYFTSFINQEPSVSAYKQKYTSVLYEKRNNKKFVFEKFKEGLMFLPIFWCNDYVLATSTAFSNNTSKRVDPSVLDEENRRKLNAIKEDDNPFIIKYYFK